MLPVYSSPATALSLGRGGLSVGHFPGPLSGHSIFILTVAMKKKTIILGHLHILFAHIWGG